MSSNISSIVELNVGGVFYSTSIGTLTSISGSKLARMFDEDTLLKDSKVMLFVYWKKATGRVLQKIFDCAYLNKGNCLSLCESRK